MFGSDWFWMFEANILFISTSWSFPWNSDKFFKSDSTDQRYFMIDKVELMLVTDDVGDISYLNIS